MRYEESMLSIFTKRSPAGEAQRAARHPERPGEQCKAAPLAYAPDVRLSRCEAKGACARVCPYDVFELGSVSDDEYRAQPLRIRLKLRVHGKRTARTPRLDACRACGMCVVACPEQAITLEPR